MFRLFLICARGSSSLSLSLQASLDAEGVSRLTVCCSVGDSAGDAFCAFGLAFGRGLRTTGCRGVDGVAGDEARFRTGRRTEAAATVDVVEVRDAEDGDEEGEIEGCEACSSELWVDEGEGSGEVEDEEKDDEVKEEEDALAGDWAVDEVVGDASVVEAVERVPNRIAGSVFVVFFRVDRRGSDGVGAVDIDLQDHPEPQEMPVRFDQAIFCLCSRCLLFVFCFFCFVVQNQKRL